VRINTILVPTDFSENAQLAFDHGHSLAQQVGATLYVLHVRDESALRTAVKEGLFGSMESDEEVQTAVVALIEQRFSAMLAGTDPSVVAHHEARRGDPKLEIVRYASEISADILIVGMRGAGLLTTLRSVVLGSVAEGLIGKSPCPVLVVRLDHRDGRG
jgi:nucleotide-binding universal stress UspA family protein